MKTKKIVTLMMVMALMMVSPVLAQGEVKKVGFLDLSKLFDGYQKTKEYDAELEKKYNEIKKLSDEKVEKLKEAQGKLALLKEEEKAKMETEIETLRNELMELQQTQGADLTKQRDEKIREILLEIEKIVSDYAKKEKYDLILNDRVLIYGNEAMDITEPILKILNENYNKKQ